MKEHYGVEEEEKKALGLFYEETKLFTHFQDAPSLGVFHRCQIMCSVTLHEYPIWAEERVLEYSASGD